MGNLLSILESGRGRELPAAQRVDSTVMSEKRNSAQSGCSDMKHVGQGTGSYDASHRDQLNCDFNDPLPPADRLLVGGTPDTGNNNIHSHSLIVFIFAHPLTLSTFDTHPLDMTHPLDVIPSRIL